MTWWQLTLDAARHDPARFEEALTLAGAVAVTWQDGGDQAVLEPPPGATVLWPRSRVSGLFAPATDMSEVLFILDQALGGLPAHTLEELAERDWLNAWRDDFRARRFGARLWVCPTSEEPPDPAGVIVRLDPGLAFGTGAHPSTALCLEWLDGADLGNKTVIDYGCGSGILAIAAAKLGARAVWAVDIDPQALLATGRNAAANGVPAIIRLATPTDPLPESVDVVLANILANPLLELAPRFADLVGPGGHLALAGILDHQADAVEAAYRPWFECGSRDRRDEWTLLRAVRRYA